MQTLELESAHMNTKIYTMNMNIKRLHTLTTGKWTIVTLPYSIVTQDVAYLDNRHVPGSIPSVLGESYGAKIVAYRTTTLLRRRKERIRSKSQLSSTFFAEGALGSSTIRAA